MIDHTPFWYTFIIACVVLLRAIAPLSIAYTFLIAIHPTNAYRLPTIFEAWFLAETVFYGVFYFYRKHHLRSPAHHPALPSREQREELTDRCLRNIPDHEEYFSRWFPGARFQDIKRDNIKEFLNWAFLNQGTFDPAYDDELEHYTQKLEKTIGKRFEDGRGNVKCIRLSLDPADMLHRSLFWYFCVLVVDVITSGYLIVHKFQYHHSSISRVLSSFPPRFHTLVGASKSPAKRLTYWSRPHTAKNKLPVVFLHGIGIGLYPYVNFLAEINNQKTDVTDGDVGIIAIETLNVSFRIAGEALLKEEFCKQLLDVVQSHGYDKFVLVSHSFGSFLTTHILQHGELAARVESIILVDPVSILLHLPDVAYNFMVRKPRRANEWQLWYFASQDAGVAHTLSRRFFWSESILWKEDIADWSTTVFLSERDLIVNTKNVHSYLMHAEEALSQPLPDTRSAAQATGHLKVIWCADLDHAQVFDSKLWRNRLLKEVDRHTSRKQA